MGHALKVKDVYEEDLVILSKEEYLFLKKESKMNKARLKFYEEMQQPLIEAIEGKTRTVEQVLDELRERKYE